MEGDQIIEMEVQGDEFLSEADPENSVMDHDDPESSESEVECNEEINKPETGHTPQV